MKRIINNLTPQKQQYEIIKNKILTLKNWTRAFHRSSLLCFRYSLLISLHCNQIYHYSLYENLF
jgi:hypothetical protein